MVIAQRIELMEKARYWVRRSEEYQEMAQSLEDPLARQQIMRQSVACMKVAEKYMASAMSLSHE